MADKYDPIRQIGKGSFGSIYLVSRRRDGAQFVLKNMQIKNVPEKEIEAYQNEVRLLTELEHPGIVSHVESFIDGDFGISKALTGSNDFAQTCIGTPYYMPPELFQNKPCGFKSDVWALGCVLYEMMTYKHAFDATSINGLAAKILKGQISALPATYPTPMRLLVKRMLDLEPKNRPSIKDILCMGFLRKHIRTYVTTVVNNEQSYRPLDIQNFKAQLRRCGLEDLLVQAPPQPLLSEPSAIPGLPLAQLSSAANGNEKASARSSAGGQAPSNACTSSGSSSASSEAQKERDRIAAEKALAAQIRHKEQAARLQQLQVENYQNGLEDKLSQFKKAHEQKHRALQVKKAVGLQSHRPSSASTPGHSARGPSTASGMGKKNAVSQPATSVKGGLKPSSSAAKLPPSSGGVSGIPAKDPSSAGKKPAVAPGVPVSSAMPIGVAKRPPSAGSSASVKPSSSPPQHNHAAAALEVEGLSSHRSSRQTAASVARSQQSEERARRLAAERREHEHALRLREIEELRAAEAARIAEAERLEARRRQVELARRKKSEVEALAIAVREKELEKARLDELSRQRKMYQADVDREKAELERIQLDKQWITKRLEDLSNKPLPPPLTGAQTKSNSKATNLRDEPTAEIVSQRDRVLAEKHAKRLSAQEAEVAALREGRLDAFQERLKVKEKLGVAPGMNKPSVAPHLQSALAGGSVVRSTTTDHPPSSDRDRDCG